MMTTEIAGIAQKQGFLTPMVIARMQNLSARTTQYLIRKALRANSVLSDASQKHDV